MTQTTHRHQTISYPVDLTTISCGKCGGVYAINERVRLKHYENGTGWNCPYCQCNWGYFGKNSQIAKLEEELEREKRNAQWAQDDAKWQRQQRINAEHRERAQKAAKTRIKNRIHNGICPCCKKRFKDLADHMRNDHPEWRGAETEKGA